MWGRGSPRFNNNFFQFWNLFQQGTMLQKLSKCEVKDWLCWNLILLSQLQFYVKSNFGKFKRPINVIFGHFKDSELWNLVNFGLESCSNLLKSKYRTSNIAKINIFGPFEFTKIWFHVKYEWQNNSFTSILCTYHIHKWKC